MIVIVFIVFYANINVNVIFVGQQSKESGEVYYNRVAAARQPRSMIPLEGAMRVRDGKKFFDIKCSFCIYLDKKYTCRRSIIMKIICTYVFMHIKI